MATVNKMLPRMCSKGFHCCQGMIISNFRKAIHAYANATMNVGNKQRLKAVAK